MSTRPKLAIVVSHPVQHFAPVYQLLAKSDNIDVVVFYYSDAGAKEHFDKDFGLKYAWDLDLLADYRHTILNPGAPVTGVGFWKMDSRRLTTELDSENPDAVMVYGYSKRLQWRAWRWARRHGKVLLYFSDSTLVSYRRKAWRRAMKVIPIRWFFRSIDVFLAVGDRNIQYLRHYGADPGKIRRCPLSVDISRFRTIGSRDASNAAEETRKKYSIPKDDFVVGFSGKLIPRKRPMDLLRAVLDLRESGRQVTALFLGSGELEESLKSVLSTSRHPDAARFPGFVNQQEIAVFYHAADAFAITSERDAHPLTATEAGACGLPIISSSQVGCVGPTDTVQDGRNALVYPCGDVEALRNCIEHLMDSPQALRQMGEASRKIAGTQDITVAARAIEDAVLESCDVV